MLRNRNPKVAAVVDSVMEPIEFCRLSEASSVGIWVGILLSTTRSSFFRGRPSLLKNISGSRKVILSRSGSEKEMYFAFSK